MCDVSTIPLAGFREPLSSISHLIGALVFAAIGILLLHRGRGDRLRMISLGVMAYVCIQMLFVSSLYHMHWPGPNRDFLLRLDVAGIFLVIAGSVTPVHVILFDGVERWAPLAVAWIAAIGGLFLRIRYFDSLPAGAGTVIFLALGWSTSVTAVVLWRRYGWKFIQFAVLSGLAYTVGAITLLLHQPTMIGGVLGPHELWHMAVLAALAMHWRFVFQFAAGGVPVYTPMMSPVPPLALPGQMIPIPITESVDPFREVA